MARPPFLHSCLGNIHCPDTNRVSNMGFSFETSNASCQNAHIDLAACGESCRIDEVGSFIPSQPFLLIRHGLPLCVHLPFPSVLILPFQRKVQE